MPRATIFLAQVTDDLKELRDNLRYELENQLDIKVVSVNRDTEDHSNLCQLIENSTLFVQLLSYADPNKHFSGMITPQLQYECAKKVKLPILQWRDPNNDSPQKQQLHLAQWLLKCPSFQDSELMKAVKKHLPFADRITYSDKPQLLALNIVDHCMNYDKLTELVEVVGIFDNGTIQFSAFKETINLLKSDDVKITYIEYFKEYILERLKKDEKKRHSSIDKSRNDDTENKPLIFINTVREDKECADKISHILDEKGFFFSLPLLEGCSPNEKREDLEENLRNCNAIILIYVNSSVRWVREQINYCWRIRGQKRDNPLKIMAVFQLSGDKQPIDTNLYDLKVLNCSTQQGSTCLAMFQLATDKQPIDTNLCDLKALNSPTQRSTCLSDFIQALKNEQ